MKMIFIVYSKAADEEVLCRIKEAGIRWYTKMKEVTGEGCETEPRLGTHIWPGENNVLYLAVQDDEVSLVADLIRLLKQEHPRAGIKGFVLPMEEII